MAVNLYTYGSVVIEVVPFSVETLNFEAQADFAPKDLVGSPRTREFVGLGDERVQFVGRLFPETIASLAPTYGPAAGSLAGTQLATSKFAGGGLNELEALDKLRREASAHMLIRGDGKNLGWYFLEGITQNHASLRGDGVPRRVEYTFSLIRNPAPRAADYWRAILRIFA